MIFVFFIFVKRFLGITLASLRSLIEKILIVANQLGNYCIKLQNLFKVYLFKVTKLPLSSGISVLALSNNCHLGQCSQVVLKYLPFKTKSYHKECSQFIYNARRLTDFSLIRVYFRKFRRYFRLQYIFPYITNILQEQETQWKHWFEMS